MLQFTQLHRNNNVTYGCAYEGFKYLFPMRNGTRQNKILLSFIKNAEPWSNERKSGNLSFVFANVKKLLWNTCNQSIKDCLLSGTNDAFFVGHKTYELAKSTYQSSFGICEDGCPQRILVNNLQTGRNQLRVKPGKYIETILNDFLPELCESTKRAFAEKFVLDWENFVKQKSEVMYNPEDEYELHLDSSLEGFKKIYSFKETGSCMTDKGLYEYYGCMKATAAWCTRKSDGAFIARCVIYDEAHNDDTDEIMRLAERQYSLQGNMRYKRILVDLLINAKRIDAYKRVGASYDDVDDYVRVSGESMNDRLSIELDESYLSNHNYVLSFQDTFVNLDSCDFIAYNYETRNTSIRLDSTEGHIEGYCGNYDDYHECYTDRDVVEVFVGDASYYCDENRLDDFVYVDSLREYHHRDDCIKCDRCDEWYLSRDSYYSELTEGDYCSTDCMYEAELEYKEEHWYYSEWDNEYYELDCDIVTAYKINRTIRGIDHYSYTVSTDSADRDFELIGDTYFLNDTDNDDDFVSYIMEHFGVTSEQIAEAGYEVRVPSEA